MIPPAHPGADEPVALLEERAEDLYEEAPCGYVSTLADGTIVKMNRTFEAWTGHRREDLLGKARLEDLLSVGGRIYYETHCRPLLLMQGRLGEIALEINCTDGRRLPVLVNAVLHRDEGGEPRVVRIMVFDATDRRAYEQELLRGRERAARLQRHTSVLAEAGRVLDAERGVEARIHALLDLLVGQMASGAALQLNEQEGLLTAGGRHAELRETLDRARGSSSTHARTDDGLTATCMAVSLNARGQELGTLAVAFEPGDDEEERLTLLQALGDRAAVAIENARLYERERAVALGLQREMLPRSLPSDDRCQMAARYVAAVGNLEVGGDWYDVVPLDSDRIAFVVGDVVGKGLDAAATMGQLRSALRAHGVSGLGPKAILEHLDMFVEHTENAFAATVAVAEVDLSRGTVRLACAGHPPPIVLPPTGDPILIWEGRSPPLGVGSARRETRFSIEHRARMLLYTDGAVERPDQDIDVGIERLMDAFASGRNDSIEATLSSIEGDAAAENLAADDVCLLAFAFEGPRSAVASYPDPP